MNNKISIITPFKNTASFLAESLRSIRNQSYPHWELLLINDHSTDESLTIAGEFSALDARIHLLQNKGNGIIEALQTGYAASTGSYITRMDSDDIMVPNRLSIMLEQLRNSGPGHLATGLVQYFSEQPIGEGYQKYEQWLNSLSAQGANFSDIYKECVIPSPCWMLHRSDFERAGAFNNHIYPEDYDLTFRFYEIGLKVIPAHHMLHHWRDYSTRTSRTHPHYADHRFLDVKMHYFLKIDYDPNRALILWGAGKKGKIMAQKLVDHGVKFTWVCDNPNKIGKNIYGQILQHYPTIKLHQNQQHIISIAEPKAQHILKKMLKEQGLNPILFC